MQLCCEVYTFSGICTCAPVADGNICFWYFKVHIGKKKLAKSTDLASFLFMAYICILPKVYFVHQYQSIYWI